MTFSDSDLRAFLAGDLSSEKTRKIEEVMMTDQALQRRIMNLDTVALEVREAMKKIPCVERLNHIEKNLPPASTKPRYTRGLRIAASLAVGIVFGWMGSDYLQEEPSVGWRNEVASYQALYVDETIAKLDNGAEVIANQFKLASDTLGLDLQQEALMHIDALTLTRAQILGFKGRPLIQVVFKSETGTPIALCIIKSIKPSKNTKLALKEIKGMASAAWSAQEYEFFLIGGQNERDIEKWATGFKSVYAQS
jgi:anti-sigma factor RsiW